MVSLEGTADALEQMASRHPDWIITEQNPHGPSGLEFLKNLNEAGKETPVVCVSPATN